MRRRIIEEIKEAFDVESCLRMYSTLKDDMIKLDLLNEQYKLKQEHHFLETFSHVMNKMGNDLLLARQAYQNVDLEVKIDDYCVDLAEKVQFFKKQCFQLREENNKLKLNLKFFKDIATADFKDNQALKYNLERKVKENIKIKSEIKVLKLQLQRISANQVTKIQDIFEKTSIPFEKSNDLTKDNGNKVKNLRNKTNLMKVDENGIKTNENQTMRSNNNDYLDNHKNKNTQLLRTYGTSFNNWAQDFNDIRLKNGKVSSCSTSKQHRITTKRNISSDMKVTMDAKVKDQMVDQQSEIQRNRDQKMNHGFTVRDKILQREIKQGEVEIIAKLMREDVTRNREEGSRNTKRE